MVSAVQPLMLHRECFADEADYLQFCGGPLARCVVALMQAVGKDILWKPLNHKVLLACRDSRASVRLMAVNMLHALFSDLGEDYLALLPECLPFISELLEDESEEVTTRAKDTARLIEEISGENIESYLMQ